MTNMAKNTPDMFQNIEDIITGPSMLKVAQSCKSLSAEVGALPRSPSADPWDRKNSIMRTLCIIIIYIYIHVHVCVCLCVHSYIYISIYVRTYVYGCKYWQIKAATPMLNVELRHHLGLSQKGVAPGYPTYGKLLMEEKLELH